MPSADGKAAVSTKAGHTRAKVRAAQRPCGAELVAHEGGEGARPRSPALATASAAIPNDCRQRVVEDAVGDELVAPRVPAVVPQPEAVAGEQTCVDKRGQRSRCPAAPGHDDQRRQHGCPHRQHERLAHPSAAVSSMAASVAPARADSPCRRRLLTDSQHERHRVRARRRHDARSDLRRTLALTGSRGDSRDGDGHAGAPVRGPCAARGDHAGRRASRTRGAVSPSFVAVNPSVMQTARVTVTVRGAVARAAVLRLLRAPRLNARHGVSFGGRAVGADGRLHGRDRPVPVVQVGGGWRFTLPPASAGLLSEPRDRRWPGAKARSTPGRRVRHQQVAVHLLGQLAAPMASPRPKPAPSSVRLPAPEALEDELARPRRHAGPAVADRDGAPCRRLATAQRDRPPGGEKRSALSTRMRGICATAPGSATRPRRAVGVAAASSTVAAAARGRQLGGDGARQLAELDQLAAQRRRRRRGG